MRPFLSCAAVVLSVLLSPLLWRGVSSAWGPAADDFSPSYLPALEPSRPREPFNPEPIDGLRDMKPGYVIIGDSMGGRIDPDRLGALTGEPIAPVLQNATGSAYWYLVFKNYVVASGIHPRRVFFFFRDTNLTDPMFRIEGPYRAHLDDVALDREEALNAVVADSQRPGWYRVHAALDRMYAVERTRAWVEPLLTGWPARVAAGSDGATVLLSRANGLFALGKLRGVSQADMESTDDPQLDFATNVNRSVLPLILSLAHEHDLPVCFVRVLRRPVDGQPPPESAALQRYVAALRAYLAAHGAGFMDDRDDPSLARLPYADGDHISRDALVAYTNRFWDRIRTPAP